MPGVPTVLALPAAGFVNIAPSGRSRLPVRVLATSTSQLACGAADRRGVDAAHRRHRFGAELSREVLDLLDPGDVIGDGPERDKLLLEQRVHDAEEEMRVGARPDEQVLVRLFGG